ncbi:MAG: 50S ribosomal protein L11 [Candidatus Chisholmbacteria bacterium RIFCSPHIGHO2_12_FULL_49_9]|uniref:Large ribosomal subunit protein uL11 n=1 Tax=Candidatus Chisholmbacteria bacterium RIFCSPHIGHO2_01_FULL_52_32 TaxID=1797591 RepID=A0A1G1VSH4_9BACT|nr:MAG: 50S ribosomal protein L11 [Candidatus Chisholmbacteria bacterium RIFCSPHIGHO2_12_FULL_49_9]OGY18157.1 MAG: 50S ribosomal protein L11 [Candidatus Chisholmbacteria bacterium RIFCSPHIGHO2_01_FULL_52_32]OGY20470.1 MAG: 50S ribosomal protein L11 [Candidatus Chisholmbacteria bacterium RIFCSPLOWO2_01_FULL_50_28]
MAAIKIKTVVKLNLKAGEATPAPPVGPTLGQHGVAIMDFVKAYNERTQDKKGQVIPAEITIYENRTFTFTTKLPPVSELIKKQIGLEKGAKTSGLETVGTLTRAQVETIAREKMQDFNTKSLESAMKTVMGTARSMGVKIS